MEKAEETAEMSRISVKEYLEEGNRLKDVTEEEAERMFVKTMALKEYSDEIYTRALAYMQKVEEKKGMRKCVEILLRVHGKTPKIEIQYAQVNSTLEVVMAKVQKYEDKWKDLGMSNEDKKKPEPPAKTTEPPRQKEPSTDQSLDAQAETPRALQTLSRPSLFSMRKLIRFRERFRQKTERIEKAVVQEEAERENINKSLELFFVTTKDSFLALLRVIADSIDVKKLFSGCWESAVAPNMQLDFLLLYMTFLESYVSLAVALERDIENQQEMAEDAYRYYKTFVGLLNELAIPEIETEVVLCLCYSMCICILLMGPVLSECSSLFTQETKLQLSERNAFCIQSGVLRSLGVLYAKKKSEVLLDIIYSFFTVGCLDTYTPGQKKMIVEQAVEVLNKHVEYKKVFQMIRRIMYTYESVAHTSETLGQIIALFLSKIKAQAKEDIREINHFFMRIIAHAPNKLEQIEPYCMFLAMHDIGIPLHHTIRRYDSQFIATFYSTYFRHPFSQEKGTKAVGDFINFVSLSDDLAYIYIMNMVPFIPSSPFIVHKLFLIYKRVYANAGMFKRGIETELLLLRMKTPALVGIAGFIFSDPKPLLRKKNLRRLAGSIGLSPNLNEDYILFLVIVRSVERAKLENYNYKGILSYLTDEITLKYMGRHLPEIILGVHRELEIDSKEFYKTYACELLKIAARAETYPLSLLIIVSILDTITQKEKTVVFSEELHVRFRECFDTFRMQETSLYSIKDTSKKYRELYSRILGSLREEATEAYNYIVLNIVDLGLFNALPVIRDERDIRELLERSNIIMQMIRSFPAGIMQGKEIWEWLCSVCLKRPAPAQGLPQMSQLLDTQKHALTTEEYNHLLYAVNTEWIRDLIKIRGETPGIIENTLSYLKWVLTEEYSFDTLLVLLQVSSREEKQELLKAATRKGYNPKEDPAAYLNLYQSAKGTRYEYFFAQTHNFLCSLLGWRSKQLKVKEFRDQELYEMDLDDLIFLNTEFNRLRKVSDVLMKKQIVRCCGFYIDMQRLTAVEALSVLANSEEEEEQTRALAWLEREEREGEGLQQYVQQIVHILKKPFRKNEEQIKLSLLGIVRNQTVHALIWELRAHSAPELLEFESLLLKTMSSEQREEHARVSEVLREFSQVSEALQKFILCEKEEKNRIINRKISEIGIPKGCLLPISGETILRLVEESGRALQSAEKVPYMVTFKVLKKGTEEMADRRVIFKFGDDCRQDAFALQLIRVFQNIFAEKGLCVFLYPYKVLATAPGSGMIEVIPKAISRDQLGRERVNNLVNYFSLKYGYREGHRYTQALKNFVQSFAGYSLVTYILSLKDRHNGNIMITDEGHMIHIDFGFMLDISPGNINIESPIKITDEIFSLLGGTGGDAFSMYRDLMIKGFYILRKRAKEIVLLVDLGRHGGLPCYTPATLKNLVSRFRLDLKDEEVPGFVDKLIISSTKKLRTWIYDQYQHLTNNIAF